MKFAPTKRVLIFTAVFLLTFLVSLISAQLLEPKLPQESSSTQETSTASEDTNFPSDSASNQTSGAKYINSYVTFYGWVDNDPPGRQIAYPQKRYPASYHNEASGVGTYDDPITLASDPELFEIGAILYVPFLKKYVVMEDWCSVCVDNWQNHQKHHIDIWMESNDQNPDKLLDCENAWTKKSTKVEIDPPSDRSVSTEALFNLSSGECLR